VLVEKERAFDQNRHISVTLSHYNFLHLCCLLKTDAYIVDKLSPYLKYLGCLDAYKCPTYNRCRGSKYHLVNIFSLKCICSTVFGEWSCETTSVSSMALSLVSGLEEVGKEAIVGGNRLVCLCVGIFRQHFSVCFMHFVLLCFSYI
jgi:hypothetical protein